VRHRRVGAGGDPGQLGPGAPLGLLHVHTRGLEHGVAAVLREDLAEVGLARAAHRDHGLYVLEGAALRPDIAPDHPHHLVVDLAAVEQAHALEAEALLTELA
jgi:hypothetical protein